MSDILGKGRHGCRFEKNFFFVPLLILFITRMQLIGIPIGICKNRQFPTCFFLCTQLNKVNFTAVFWI